MDPSEFGSLVFLGGRWYPLVELRMNALAAHRAAIERGDLEPPQAQPYGSAVEIVDWLENREPRVSGGALALAWRKRVDPSNWVHLLDATESLSTAALASAEHDWRVVGHSLQALVREARAGMDEFAVAAQLPETIRRQAVFDDGWDYDRLVRLAAYQVKGGDHGEIQA